MVAGFSCWATLTCPKGDLAMNESMDNLERFLDAQAPELATVRRELAAGRKRTHWMWFVFPQLRGLGRSETARHFGIASRADADAYLRHPVLGARLRDCVDLIMATHGPSAHDIFGTPDDLKLRSCLTLFRDVEGRGGLFDRALDKFFQGEADALTLQLLAADR
jgi:uncharacterized protein (DUF1810 family)